MKMDGCSHPTSHKLKAVDFNFGGHSVENERKAFRIPSKIRQSDFHRHCCDVTSCCGVTKRRFFLTARSAKSQLQRKNGCLALRDGRAGQRTTQKSANVCAYVGC
jgi:hypothetical protein